MTSPTSGNRPLRLTIPDTDSLPPPQHPENDNPTWRKVLSCVPVVSLIMQCINDRWIRKQCEENGTSMGLLLKGRFYEKCACGGNMLTVIGLIILATTVIFPPVTIGAVAALAIYGVGLILTSKRIEDYNEKIRSHIE